MSLGPVVPTEEYFDKGAWGWDGTRWRKLGIQWGYSDRLAAKVTHTKIGNGTYTMPLVTVPSGWVYVLQAVLTYDVATTINHRHFIGDGTDLFEIAYFTAQTAATWAVTDGLNYTLKAGDVCTVQFVASLDADILYGRAWGYTMEVG